MRAAEKLKPGMLLISGDVTQNGSAKEYRATRKLLDDIGLPYMCVPGNHDIHRINLWKRFVSPYKHYKAFIQREQNPEYSDDLMVLSGLNSSRRILPHWNWANGAVSGEQMEMMENVMNDANGRWRVLMLHHPVHSLEAMPIKVVVFGANQLMERLQQAKVDLVLSGHIHHASFVIRRSESGHPTVFLSAATALSSRKRTHANGFNLITLDETTLKVVQYNYVDGNFSPLEEFTHKREEGA